MSSGAVRDALAAGHVTEATELLGYPWFVTAQVVHGDKRGRELGYPTANLRLGPDCGLKHGIYAVRVGVGGTRYDGVASFGRRPTFDNGAVLLEVFLFDFSGDLYGAALDVAFIGWIRPEMKFDSVDELIRRMDEDCQPGAHRAGAGAGRVSAAGRSRLVLCSGPPATQRAMNDKPGEAKSGERDYSQTLFLPQTEFPMRAGLPQREPEILARWKKLGLYERLREAGQGPHQVRAARRPALRQRQHPHRPRAQQDPEGRGDAQPADARLRFATTCRAGTATACRSNGRSRKRTTAPRTSRSRTCPIPRR